jgi:type I restriction-modification system DNA methylase subunit
VVIDEYYLVRKDAKSIKPVNYTIDNQKITFEFLKSHLWSAADILRGSLDPSEYRHPVMTLLFLKRLNDTFEENAENLIKQGKSQKDAYENRRRHTFFASENGQEEAFASYNSMANQYAIRFIS